MRVDLGPRHQTSLEITQCYRVLELRKNSQRSQRPLHRQLG
ncbi:hypothetical protein HanXRQr2_Chr07g0288431 [Helianthus annuus]|uniref:Uncharacterized protein n=1 Tax=Helianthus annuus TaxID=4232 RepID=A0A9K3IKI7_HELAN|nr:hypothetical protein HanXRQr2_Chr07g0288431 [Helianthus annuus]KAJ0904199.1 hypothetical protein HanPSC8_Chr07g0279211 [Helianthus annuus]